MTTWIDTVDDAKRSQTPPLGVTWYAQPNDILGGWCVMPVDKPPGEAKIQEVADVVDETTARHLADIHNRWLLELLPQRGVNSWKPKSVR
jgi:hypothetical protein